MSFLRFLWSTTFPWKGNGGRRKIGERGKKGGRESGREKGVEGREWKEGGRRQSEGRKGEPCGRRGQEVRQEGKQGGRGMVEKECDGGIRGRERRGWRN